MLAFVVASRRVARLPCMAPAGPQSSRARRTVVRRKRAKCLMQGRWYRLLDLDHSPGRTDGLWSVASGETGMA
jgi:hypothetical protein